MRNVLIIVYLFGTLMSCKENISEKNDENNGVEQKTSSEDIKENFVVKLNIEYLKNDNIWLFYTEEYQEYSIPVENMLQQSVKGQEGYQWVTFEFPSDVFPERIKILFSNNKDQNTLKIKEILFSRDGNVLKVDGDNFVNYFNFSKFISTLNGYELHLKTVDGAYDPNIVSSSQFDTELIKL